MKKVWYILALLAVFMVVIAVPKLGKATSQEVTETPEQSLPTVGTVEKLRSILTEAESSRTLMGQGGGFRAGDVMLGGATKSAQAPATPAPASPSLATGGNSSDYSTTNLQVDGVDEADIIKNDGHYIYQVNNQELIVTQAYPTNPMSIVSRIGFKQGEFTPRELYVDDHYLVLIGNAYYKVESQGAIQPSAPSAQFQKGSQMQQYPPVFTRSTSKVIIYDLADKANLKKLREVELDGMYVSSRKVGSNLYLIANKYLDTYQIMQQGVAPALPSYRDTVGKGDFITIGYNDIHYFPNAVEPNYLLIGGLDLDKRDKEMQVSTYLGSGQNIYASTSNLYVAVNQQQLIDQPKQPPSTPQPAPMPQPAPNSSSTSTSSSTSPSIAPKQLNPNALKITTALYKFGLAQGGTTFKAKGEVPGTILNQFAMDEAKGFFRIATTTGQIWRTDELTSKNNVYILDEALQLKGKIEDIAPGEKIYSVRFMGNRGYMVTFKSVDPFFVLDLEDPASPTILGALKIPGFSDYLQPYDENHIIGFGKETVELSQNNGQGILPGAPTGSTTAFYQGLKLAVFDVTDVTHPVEMFKTVIGDRGTDSEVLRNHKALLFDKEKGILSFPVTLMEVKNPGVANSGKGFPEYGQFTYQGAYVYQFDLRQGFTLRGKITHLGDVDLLKAGQNYRNGSKAIERIMFINDTLYTISKGMIKANDLASLQEKNSLILNP